jgi:hypothetical protein
MNSFSKTVMPVLLGLFFISGSVFVSSCKKDEPVKITDSLDLPEPGTGAITMKFKNTCNGSNLILDFKKYLNANGDSFQVSSFNYYISNLVFNKADGTKFIEKESYHLIKAEDDKTWEFTMLNVPPGEYNSVNFLIGVDSARNVSGAQTGALDPAQGMFWTWSTGYIMAKMEGTSSSSPAGGNTIAYHIAGFEGKENGIKPVTITFPSPLVVSGGVAKKFVLRAELDTWFGPPNVIDFATHPTVVTLNATSNQIAANYSKMFTFSAFE